MRLVDQQHGAVFALGRCDLAQRRDGDVVDHAAVDEQRAVLPEADEYGADAGVAWDGDFDRCFLFDEKGTFIEGYYIVGLLAEQGQTGLNTFSVGFESVGEERGDGGGLARLQLQLAGDGGGVVHDLRYPLGLPSRASVVQNDGGGGQRRQGGLLLRLHTTHFRLPATPWPC